MSRGESAFNNLKRFFNNTLSAEWRYYGSALHAEHLHNSNTGSWMTSITVFCAGAELSFTILSVEHGEINGVPVSNYASSPSLDAQVRQTWPFIIKLLAKAKNATTNQMITIRDLKNLYDLLCTLKRCNAFSRLNITYGQITNTVTVNHRENYYCYIGPNLQVERIGENHPQHPWPWSTVYATVCCGSTKLHFTMKLCAHNAYRIFHMLFPTGYSYSEESTGHSEELSPELETATTKTIEDISLILKKDTLAGGGGITHDDLPRLQALLDTLRNAPNIGLMISQLQQISSNGQRAAALPVQQPPLTPTHTSTSSRAHSAAAAPSLANFGALLPSQYSGAGGAGFLGTVVAPPTPAPYQRKGF